MNKENQKIGFMEKVSYGMANLGNIPVLMVVNSFLLIYYTNVVGLNPAACATLFLIARIIDAVNDPFIGFLVDRFPNTKMGHFRVTLIIGSILCSLNYLLLWFGPLWATEFKLGIAYISYLLLGVLFPVMDISLNSLLPVMTVDMKERNSLSAIKGTFYMVGGVAVGIAAPLIIGDASESKGYIKLIICAVAVILIFSVVGALGVRERVKAKPGQSYGVKDLFKIITQKPVLIIFIGNLLYTTGTTMQSTVNTYFFTYILKNLAMLSAVSLISMVVMFPGLAISGVLAPRIGKKKVYMLGLGISLIVPLIRLFDVTNTPLLLLATSISSFGMGIMMPQMYSIQADNTDYVEIATGQRAEGAVASLASFTSKFAMGIGGALPGYFLALAGFDAAAKTQTTIVNNTIVACSITVPAILVVIAICVIGFKYPLTKEKLDLQIEEMKRRHKES